MDDEEWFNELYEDYTGWGIGMDLQNADDCKSVMKRLMDEYNASPDRAQHE